MPNEYPRSHRVADYIQRELSELIRSEVKDPGLSPMLTLSSVEVSRDLSTAKVYYSLLDSNEQAETQQALVRATGFLRRQLAKRMQTRSVPTLRFYHDDSAERGAHMSKLIAEAVASNTTAADERPADDYSLDGTADTSLDDWDNDADWDAPPSSKSP